MIMFYISKKSQKPKFEPFPKNLKQYKTKTHIQYLPSPFPKNFPNSRKKTKKQLPAQNVFLSPALPPVGCGASSPGWKNSSAAPPGASQKAPAKTPESVLTTTSAGRQLSLRFGAKKGEWGGRRKVDKRDFWVRFQVIVLF